MIDWENWASNINVGDPVSLNNINYTVDELCTKKVGVLVMVNGLWVRKECLMPPVKMIER